MQATGALTINSCELLEEHHAQRDDQLGPAWQQLGSHTLL